MQIFKKLEVSNIFSSKFNEFTRFGGSASPDPLKVQIFKFS